MHSALRVGLPDARHYPREGKGHLSRLTGVMKFRSVFQVFIRTSIRTLLGKWNAWPRAYL